MAINQQSESRGLYTFVVLGLLVFAIGNVIRRDWMMGSLSACLLTVVMLSRDELASRSLVSKIAFWTAIAGFVVIVTLSVVRG